ncbi:MAG: hypothetical protein C4547_01690 [Phycisphaerales bacterium]|nr:MAG: hypothetical protein C4547_01690 [Phycisphaerales bacterium]
MTLLRTLKLCAVLPALIAPASCTVTGDDPSDNQPNANQPADNDPAENRPSDNGNANEVEDNDNAGGPVGAPPSIAVVGARLETDPGGGYVVFLTLQPTEDEPSENTPYDADSDVTVYVLLDINDDPDDDDIEDIDFERTALLDKIDVEMGEFEAMDVRASAEPDVLFEDPTYPLYVRVSITDGVNPPVHVYAPIQIEE